VILKTTQVKISRFYEKNCNVILITYFVM